MMTMNSLTMTNCAMLKQFKISVEQFVFGFKPAISEFDILLKSSWKKASDNGYCNYILEEKPNIKMFSFANINLIVLALMPRFSLRRKKLLFKQLDEPCFAENFNFTKVKENEKLFTVICEEFNCSGEILLNASPFMFGHSLLVPNPIDLLSQVLSKNTIKLALNTMLASNDEYMCLGFNSLLAHASVNHLHFHLWYSSEKLHASACKIVMKKSLPNYYELEHHLVQNFVFQFQGPNDYETVINSLWNVVSACQQLGIAHNMFAARNSEGCLRVVLWPRRSAFDTKTCNSLTSQDFDIAVAELAGMLVVPSDSVRSKIMDQQFLTAKFLQERVSLEVMETLQHTLCVEIDF